MAMVATRLEDYPQPEAFPPLTTQNRLTPLSGLFAVFVPAVVVNIHGLGKRSSKPPVNGW